MAGPARDYSSRAIHPRAGTALPILDPRINIGKLLVIFVAWKVTLLLISVSSPGPGYDTSTRIFVESHHALSASASWHDLLLNRVVLCLTRWDAIYFTSASLRGHVHEQAWAFSPYLSRLTSAIARVVSYRVSTRPVIVHALVGISISHFSHLIAVLALYQLTVEIIPAVHDKKHRVAFITAVFHVLSPAGLFLSAPYAEAPFAASTFLAIYLYIAAQKTRSRSEAASAWQSAALLVSSGALFGQAVLLRGNGLLAGLIFAWDAALHLPNVPSMLKGRAWSQCLHLAALLVGGALIGIAYAAPQLLAYLEYCTSENTRPWCHHWPPGIYAFVQDHYWNVGLFRYWTLSNLPLFAIAAPMLLVLVGTAWTALTPSALNQMMHELSDSKEVSRTGVDQARLFAHVMPRLALPQLLLALLALTSFHVQIVNRISSGYPVWYLLLAISFSLQGQSSSKSGRLLGALRRHSNWLVRLMVTYAMVQGGLYASFLPPA